MLCSLPVFILYDTRWHDSLYSIYSRTSGSQDLSRTSTLDLPHLTSHLLERHSVTLPSSSHDARSISHMLRGTDTYTTSLLLWHSDLPSRELIPFLDALIYLCPWGSWFFSSSRTFHSHARRTWFSFSKSSPKGSFPSSRRLYNRSRGNWFFTSKGSFTFALDGNEPLPRGDLSIFMREGAIPFLEEFILSSLLGVDSLLRGPHSIFTLEATDTLSQDAHSICASEEANSLPWGRHYHCPSRSWFSPQC